MIVVVTLQPPEVDSIICGGQAFNTVSMHLQSIAIAGTPALRTATSITQFQLRKFQQLNYFIPKLDRTNRNCLRHLKVSNFWNN
jgi:hypothetical protein